MSVMKESIWTASVDRTIQGLREAADQLAAAGVPASAAISTHCSNRWLNVEARWLWTDDEDDDLEDVPLEPSEIGA